MNDGMLKIDYTLQKRAHYLKAFFDTEATSEKDAARAAKLRSASWMMGNIEHVRLISHEDVHFCPRCQSPMRRNGAELICTSCFHSVYENDAKHIAMQLRSHVGEYVNAHDGMFMLLQTAADLIDVMAEASYKEGTPKAEG